MDTTLGLTTIKQLLNIYTMMTLNFSDLIQFANQATGLSQLFKAMADETRTKILYVLSRGEICVHDLAQVFSFSLPAVSHHLRLLKMINLVSARRDGKHVYYRLADDHVMQLIHIAMAHYAESNPKGANNE